MGELFICNEPIAALPYYIEGIAWNVYSLEELCYYIENNTYLLDKDFMTEELCTWIGKEVKNLKLAERLRDIMRMDGRLSEFVSALLVESGYCPRETTKEIVRIVREMEEKSDFECNKLRADRLMEKEKYLSSIYEYKRLLDSNEAGEQSKELLGNIWHNLGTAYARLFLFQEANRCYEKAFALNQNPESLKESMLACKCLQKELDAEYFGYETEIFAQRLDEIAKLNNREQKAKYQKAISDIIFNWKEEYRRICRV